jgi:hypothetical protein
MRVKGVRIWVTGEAAKWDDQVPSTIAKRIEALVTAAFQELIDEGVIDVSSDDVDEIEVEEEHG